MGAVQSPAELRAIRNKEKKKRKQYFRIMSTVRNEGTKSLMYEDFVVIAEMIESDGFLLFDKDIQSMLLIRRSMTSWIRWANNYGSEYYNQLAKHVVVYRDLVNEVITRAKEDRPESPIWKEIMTFLKMA